MQPEGVDPQGPKGVSSEGIDHGHVGLPISGSAQRVGRVQLGLRLNGGSSREDHQEGTGLGVVMCSFQAFFFLVSVSS